MHTDITEKYAKQFREHSWDRETLIQKLFLDEELKNIYSNEIRRATVVGHTANAILSEHSPHDLCKILAIGDIRYFGDQEEKWHELVTGSLQEIDPLALSGYDLWGLGSKDFRGAICAYMSHYYPLSALDGNITDRIIPSYGGTDSFVSILNILKNETAGKSIRFIYPEASFLANVKIAEVFLGKDSLVSIPKPASDDFFLSTAQISALQGKKSDMDMYYITPVGNPTGNKIGEDHIYEILETIHDMNPKAVFIMDSVYVGLLPNEVSNTLFERIFSHASLMQRIIFSESASKTLGTTGIRIGWSWTMNESWSEKIKSYTTLTKAWFSKILDSFGTNLLGNPDIFAFQGQVYEFWSRERLLFLKYMKTHFENLFDFGSSPSVSDREGIYVLLKIQGSYTKEYVFAKTGIVGVGIELSDGKYIRYAFGNVNYFSSTQEE